MDFRSLLFALCLLCMFSSRLSVQADDDVEDHISNTVGSATDDDSASRNEKSVSQDGYSVEELRVIEATRQDHTFQAEVNKLMGIIINSLYSNTEIFLRELISNASDALDKIRYKSITDPSLLSANPNLDIRVRADSVAQTLTITDSGVGMTKDELIAHLGTIAQSGTANFLKNLKSNNEADLGLIGQFGVGFYSAFLVADRVVVHSKSNDSDKQYVWDASSQQSYTVYEDPKQDLGRGTSIVLHIKDSAKEFLEADRLRSLVQQYSEFIDFPIFLWASHEEEIASEKEEKDATDEFDVEDVEEEEAEPKFETVWGWERVNDLKPLWARKPSDVTEEEYTNFYKSFTKDHADPLTHLHFSAEGDINFRSILFIPKNPPANLYDGTERKDGLKLYVRRVFITDDFSEIIPRYLNFLKGVVDSDDLPLNVSREMLQKNRLLTSMKKKLVRKAIGMIQDLAKDNEKYLEFYEKYATSLKLGIIEDDGNKQRLEKLLRFATTKSDEPISFERYVERMKEGQKDIYYFASQDEKEAMLKSPLIEKLVKKDIEVLLMVDPIDEYVFQQGVLTKFGDHTFVNVAKEDLKIEGEEEPEEDYEEKYEELLDYLKNTLKGKVTKAKISERLTDSPSALTSSQWGWTGNMEKLAKAQALGDKSMHKFYKGQRVLEINPTHPIIVELNSRVAAGPDSFTEDVSNLLYETALLSSGYELEDHAAFAKRIHNMLKTSLGLEVEAEAEEGETGEDAPEYDEL